MNQWEELLEYFKGKSIGDIWPLDRNVITVGKSQTLAQCLQILEDHMILSLPVVEDQVKGAEGDYLGQVDTIDIVMFLLGTLDPDSIIGSTEKIITSSNLKEYTDKLPSIQHQYETITVGELLEKCSTYRKQRQEDVFPEYYRKSDPIIELIGMFSIGLHRVAILSQDSEPNKISPFIRKESSTDTINQNTNSNNKDTTPTTSSNNNENGDSKKRKKLVNVITQSDLLAILGQCLPLFGSSLQSKTMKQLHLIEKPLMSVTENQTVLEILAAMRGDSPPLTAIPIVDSGQQGRVLATFSASNLKGLTRLDWKDLGMPCLEFLKKQHDVDVNKPFPISIQSRKSLHPITCTLDSTVESVVMKMLASRVHRLWCIDETKNGKLIGVVSMSDVFQILLPAELFESCFIV